MSRADSIKWLLDGFIPDGSGIDRLLPNMSTANRTSRPRKPNYNHIHALPLPVPIYPSAVLLPHNPLSVLHVLGSYLSQLWRGPALPPRIVYKACCSSETLSIHATDPVAIRALWESGFFGKGSLSRSEPSWLEREKRRLGLSATQTSEEITQKRREERKEFKRNRAKMEREIIESQLQKEGKKLSAVEAGVSKPNVNDAKSHSVLQEPNSTKDGQAALLPAVNSSTVPPSRTSSVSFIADKSIEAKNPAPLAQKLKFETTLPRKASGLAAQRQTDPDPPTEVRDQEHLQLTPEEAFFLVYGLGILEVWDDDGRAPMATASLFQRFRQWSYFPPRSSSLLQMDDPFILSYVVYHHFRSLGWVVRSGVKFATDYLLYNRGPVFSHAEFAAVIIPSYSHPYYADCPHQQQLGKSRGSKSWHWLHCVNRVQSQVRKNLVLVFVEVPPPLEHGMGGEQPDQFVTDIGGMLKRYQVREVNVKRWIPNRSRD